MTEKRASKKQRELLVYIEGFIKENNYGPSYREVMRALDYKSVSTVAVHIDGLIAAGLLRKTDNSARSLEIIFASESKNTTDNSVYEQWLQKEIIKRTEQLTAKEDERLRKEIVTLESAFRILGFLSAGEKK